MVLCGIEEKIFCQFIYSINKILADNAHRERMKPHLWYWIDFLIINLSYILPFNYATY